MDVNWKQREVCLKIVYYGPTLSGKSTNLHYIHARTAPEVRGDILALNTGRGHQTFYFDFLQLQLSPIAGLKPRINLYAVPGDLRCPHVERLLHGVDGIIFVADSRLTCVADNVEALYNLTESLLALDHEPADLPLVVQLNKRDLPHTLPAPLLQDILGLRQVPCVEAVATQGVGVLETMRTAVNLVIAEAQQVLI
jgi:hypothetical protein